MTAAEIASGLVIYSLIASCECVDLSVRENEGIRRVHIWCDIMAYCTVCHHPVYKCYYA